MEDDIAEELILANTALRSIKRHILDASVVTIDKGVLIPLALAVDDIDYVLREGRYENK